MAVPLGLRCKDISTVDDNVLRPWTQNPSLDDEIDSSIQLLNETITTLSYERNAGAQGASLLDRPPTAITEFAKLVQNEGWLDTALEQEEQEREVAEDEESEARDEVPLAEDAELLQYLQDIQRVESRADASRPSTCHSGRSEVLVLDGNTEQFRQLQRQPQQRIRSAAYMPNIRSPMYREWLSVVTARNEVNDNNNAAVSNRRPSTSSGRVGTASLFSSDSAPLHRSHMAVEDSAEVQRRIFTPASPKQLPALTPTFASLFADDEEGTASHKVEPSVPPIDLKLSSRPATSGDNKPHLPPPQAVHIAALPMSPHRKKMLESLGLPPPNSSRSDNSCRQSNKTSKRSKRGVASAADDNDAASLSSRSISTHSNSSHPSTPNPFSDRHDASSRPITPALSSIGISTTSGTAVTVPTYTRRRLRQMKSLRDQLLTSTGSFNLPSHPDSPVAMDSSASYRRTQTESRDCALRNQLDSTWDVLQTAGYFEKVGPNRIYTSQTADFFKDDPKRDDMVKSTDKSYFFQTDDIRKWTDEAVKLGKKPFVSGGVIRI